MPCSPHLRRWVRCAPAIGRYCTRVSKPPGPRHLMHDLFADTAPAEERDEVIAPGAVLLRGFALAFVDDILPALADIAEAAPFRQMTTPWGAVMSVAMTNCGDAGWLTDRTGYRYDRIDPQSGAPWPAMPACFFDLATGAASR